MDKLSGSARLDLAIKEINNKPKLRFSFYSGITEDRLMKHNPSYSPFERYTEFELDFQLFNYRTDRNRLVALVVDYSMFERYLLEAYYGAVSDL